MRWLHVSACDIGFRVNGRRARRVGSSPQRPSRVDGLAVVSDLVVEMVTSGVAAVAHGADRIAASDAIPMPDGDFLQVGVAGFPAAAVIDHHQPPEVTGFSGEGHAPIGG